MRLLTLALLGILTLGSLSFGQEPDTVQARLAEVLAEHEAAHDAHEADREAWLAAMAEYPLAPAAVPAAAPAPAVAAAPAPEIEERMGFGLAYLNDGGCAVAGKSLRGSYSREAAESDIYAQVRTAPSGGNCEVNATSFSLAVERRYEIASGWSAMAKFGADRRSTSAPYAIVDGDGMVLTRADGAPSDPVTLPAGAADTIGAYLGVASPDFSGFRLTVAGNVVPVDWAAEDDGLVAHLAVSYDVGDGFDLDAWVDVGRDHYGAARASWRPSVAGKIGLEITAGYDWGLTAVDDGAAFRQTFAGLAAHKQGPARDHATHVAVGISF